MILTLNEGFEALMIALGTGFATDIADFDLGVGVVTDVAGFGEFINSDKED